MFGGVEPASHLQYLEHPLYERYMHLPKGVVTPPEARILQEVHEGLSSERASRFLFAGGWAAAEAAIVMRGARNNQKMREQLVEGAADNWLRAHERVVAVGQAGQETNDHYALKQRIELALASIPLLEGIVAGDVRVRTLEQVTDDYLQIGVENTAFSRDKRQSGDELRAIFHEGLSYEIVALLGLNDRLTTRRFAMPSTARNDSGYHASKLTHDLMIINQRVGKIESIIPVEVKSNMTRINRRRYKALIVDSRVMDVLQAGEPGATIDLFARVRDEVGSEADRKADKAAVSTMVGELWGMVAQYTSGERVKTGEKPSIVRYHEANKVRLGAYALWAA
jgi:hypothetical protein